MDMRRKLHLFKRFLRRNAYTLAGIRANPAMKSGFSRLKSAEPGFDRSIMGTDNQAIPVKVVLGLASLKVAEILDGFVIARYRCAGTVASPP